MVAHSPWGVRIFLGRPAVVMGLELKDCACSVDVIRSIDHRMLCDQLRYWCDYNGSYILYVLYCIVKRCTKLMVHARTV